MKIDEDPSCRHTFEFGRAKHDRFSDNARNKMKAALDNGIDMNGVWKEHRPGLHRKQALPAVAAVETKTA
ncbi:MAG: hypothetical protein IH626_02000 [Rhodospirillales bacterium]|nr:hypothetical protein [Rhodospirillales bacterium]